LKASILIVDDKERIYESLSKNFTRFGYTCYSAGNKTDALNLLLKKHFCVVLLDIKLGTDNGIDVLQEIRRIYNDVPVIMITGFATIETAVESMRIGAFDYIQKPINFENLLKIVETAVGHIKNTRARESIDTPLENIDCTFETKNEFMLDTISKSKRFALTDLPVLIQGESGTGKEFLADFIHSNSNRKENHFIKINCAAFAESLLDNELFGHEKGAYTGAQKLFRGVFERAHKGTLFLDEIGDMPLSIQAKILRSLQNKEIRRLGGDTTITVDVRFIAATNKALDILLEQNLFREDLFYRLNAAPLILPPLRERKDDIPLLIDFFLRQINRTREKTLTIDKTTVEILSNYTWPGNIRELKNVINYAASLCITSSITIKDLPPIFSDQKNHPEPENIRENIERNLIISALKDVNNNKTKAADLLKMSRKTLYNKMQKYGLLQEK